MKKILIVIALLCFVVVGAFAQSQQNQDSAVPLTVLITEPYDGYTISIEYTEMLGEARFIYSTNRFTYDEYDAIKIARERIIAFTKEKGYFSYSYMRPTITKTDYEKNKTYFYSFVLFDK
ncbi:MAG: hypothetical protein J5798_09490 [Spirochaetaceae bacterium]|nr:hypothetical protein [Spirochaetaceae bacterium]MBO4727958.1 hypothetical protein [Spirochaetaceae bacterium]MBR4824746.1 hypothetical protein [Spirochaetaceae bacterium]